MRVFFLSLFFLFSTSITLAQTPELTLQDAWFVKGPIELSGLTLSKGRFFTLSDGDKDRHIKKLTDPSSSNIYKPKTFIDLKKLEGWAAVEKRLLAAEQAIPGSGVFDLEGIAICDDTFYLANERPKLIHRVTATSIETLDLKWGKYSNEILEGGINAGFEGIAVDCAKNQAYIAKERQPRKIYQFDLNTLELIGAFEISSSSRAGQKTLNQDNPDMLIDIQPDAADLYLEKDHLYLLERHSREITKIDLNTKKVLARVSYFQTEKGLYDTPTAFGQAEGLTMNEESIFVAFDNNGSPLSHKSEKTYKVKGDEGFIGKFQRPKDF